MITSDAAAAAVDAAGGGAAGITPTSVASDAIDVGVECHCCASETVTAETRTATTATTTATEEVLL